MALIQLSKCFSQPKYFLKFLATLTCICIATYQLSGCIGKILHPPTSTHNSFKLNQTLRYPALTICRNPGFKTEKFAKYGLTELSVPAFTSFWQQFNFENYTLDEFFEDTTYRLEEVVPLHGFDGRLNSLEIQEIAKLTYGKCFKFTPTSLSDRWDKAGGYCLYLMMSHVMKPCQDPLPVALESGETFKEQPKLGFHVFVHEPSERISDDGDQSESFMEYIYVENQQDLKYSLSVSEYKNLPSQDNDCRNDDYYNYSKSMCEELCLLEVVTEEVGCSAPWLDNKLYPRCSTYEKTKSLIQLYNEYSQRNNNNCNCPRSCNITIYMPHINEGKRLDYEYQSAFSLYYLSNLVTVTEEIAVYDWSLFISDLGGSLGFMLGLSVLGLISMVVQTFKMCYALCAKEQHGDAASKATRKADAENNNTQQRALVIFKEKTYLDLNELYHNHI